MEEDDKLYMLKALSFETPRDKIGYFRHFLLQLYIILSSAICLPNACGAYNMLLFLFHS
jgi:hypothetical protein